MSTKRNSTKSSTRPQELTRRQLLAGLAALPLLPLTLTQAPPPAVAAEQPPTAPVSEISEPSTPPTAAPDVAGDITTDEVAMIKRVLIPCYNELLQKAHARLAELTAGGGV